MRHIAAFITARPSYARCKSVLTALAERGDCRVTLVASAYACEWSYGDVASVAHDEGVDVVRIENCVVHGDTRWAFNATTSRLLERAGDYLAFIRPDMAIVIADRPETNAVSHAARNLGIPLAHIQGGEVSGNEDDVTRWVNTALADLHFVANAQAARLVRQHGEAKSRVYITGCPSIDLAREAAELPPFTPDEFRLLGGVGAPLQIRPLGYVVVQQHPETATVQETDEATWQVWQTIKAVAAMKATDVVWFWPGADPASESMSKALREAIASGMLPHVHFFRNLPPSDFLRLLNHAACLVGNSSVGIRECSYLGVPVVNIGTRQRGRARAWNVTDCAHDNRAVLACIKDASRTRHESSWLYGDGYAGERIAEVLATAELSTEKRKVELTWST